MKPGAMLNETRLASVVFLVTLTLSGSALAGDGARCNTTGCQTMSAHLSCKLYGSGGNDKTQCRTHQSSRQKPRPFGGNGGQILPPAAGYAIDRGSTICN